MLRGERWKSRGGEALGDESGKGEKDNRDWSALDEWIQIDRGEAGVSQEG